MTHDEIIRMAREAGLAPICSACDEPDVSYAYEDWDEELEAFASLVAAAEREACAKEAESLWQQYCDTKDAHERLSPEPFMPGRFGFDQSTLQQSRRIADAIRARGQA